MIIEAEIQKRLLPGTGCVDTAYLIETRVRLVAIGKLPAVCLYKESPAYADVAVAEQAETSRVRTDGRNVCAQCFHRTAHTDVTCRTVQVFPCQFCILVCLLCIR